ncbi:hypothetical protein [Schaalia sp. ZJ405]|nr:hypothetical protein [Schaalia sp. ZJ405]
MRIRIGCNGNDGPVKGWQRGSENPGNWEELGAEARAQLSVTR